MKKLIFWMGLAFFTVQAAAQQNQYTKKADNDPKAKAVLDKMQKKYEAYKTLEADFSLVIELPEQPKQTQKGKLTQQGDKYRLKMSDRTLVSDGKSVWLYTVKKKDVQVNDVEENDGSGGISSPQDLLKAYAWSDYVYVLSDELTEKGRVVQQIEFKPLLKSNDYSKIRLTVDKTTAGIVSIKSFGKDGGRYTLTMDKLTPNKTVDAATFTFAKTECPDCHFEDLRVD